MKKQILFLSLIVTAVLLGNPLALCSQVRTVYSRTSISRLDVLSRSALFEPAIAEAARAERVDPLILWTIAYNESRFRPWVTSPQNAQGLMQFIPATASRFGLVNPYEPRASIIAAAKYVKVLGELFDWRLDSILAAYNSGEGTVTAYRYGKTLFANGKKINPSKMRTNGGVPPYKETTNYVANGLKIYRWLTSQNRFAPLKNEAVAKLPMSPRQSLEIDEYERIRSASSVKNEARPESVFYDPRTGNRQLFGEEKRLLLLKQKGPVIISPETRIVPNQVGRSTFASEIK
ncbi:MAG: lytic transglycosylase domain-containing protein [Pyrinomonadaceae bacterium]